MTRQDKTRTKKTAATAATSLPAVQAIVAGIDVGGTQHWVCGPARGDDGKPVIRSFGTTPVDLEALVDWLVAKRRQVGRDGEHVRLQDITALHAEALRNLASEEATVD